MKNLREELKKRIPTVEAAYKETGRPEVDFSVYPEDLRVHKKACYDAEILVEAARKIERENGLGEIDWSNWEQYKFIPWFKMRPSSFSFFVTYFDLGVAYAGCGSRLRVLALETAEYLGEKFIEVWKNVQLG
jgi:hypothetical protein